MCMQSYKYMDVILYDASVAYVYRAFYYKTKRRA